MYYKSVLNLVSSFAQRYILWSILHTLILYLVVVGPGNKFENFYKTRRRNHSGNTIDNKTLKYNINNKVKWNYSGRKWTFMELNQIVKESIILYLLLISHNRKQVVSRSETHATRWCNSLYGTFGSFFVRFLKGLKLDIPTGSHFFVLERV